MGTTTPLTLREAAPFFFHEPYHFVLIGQSSGFSGSSLARVTDSSGLGWCLRAWPSGTDPERLAFIHQALSHSRAKGFSGLPRLKPTLAGPTFLTLGDHLFDAPAAPACHSYPAANGSPLSRGWPNH
jgi:hypothetical protein